jgi:hypothetical protein
MVCRTVINLENGKVSFYTSTAIKFENILQSVIPSRLQLFKHLELTYLLESMCSLKHHNKLQVVTTALKKLKFHS